VSGAPGSVTRCSLADNRGSERTLSIPTAKRCDYCARHATVLFMSASDLDIHRAAHLLIAHHGDNATAVAREMVETMRQKGDAEGADTWLRIIVAIGTLGTPPTDSRH
jgi:hypothetical protein